MLKVGELDPPGDGVILQLRNVFEIRNGIIMRHERERVRNAFREAHRGDILERIGRVLDNVVQQRSADRFLRIHLLRQMERMENVRQPALVELIPVRLEAEPQSLFG